MATSGSLIATGASLAQVAATRRHPLLMVGVMAEASDVTQVPNELESEATN
jgi:hypothetical protein